MERVAPKPPIAIDGPVIRNSIEPRHLEQPVTATDPIFVLAHVAIPDVAVDDWSLEICGLVGQRLELGLDDLLQLPQTTVESIHQCAGNPFEPTLPSRQIANVVWRGVDLRLLLDQAGADASATFVWSYGLDYGEFFGHEVAQYVKDLPLSRVGQGDVLIAHSLNDEPLSIEHGFPARLVVPGYYGTNSVKWICRLELADRRPEGLFTTELYNDPAEDGGTRPVWEIAPQSMFVCPEPEARVDLVAQRIWGRAWSASEIASVDVSFDGGESWQPADVTPRRQRGWQTFSIDWQPPGPGTYRLQCRATDAGGSVQPADGARNSIHSVDVIAG